MQVKKRGILKWIGLTLGGILLAVLLLLVLAIADTVGCFHEPPLWIEKSGTTVIVHVETLGEYVSAVGHIRIQEASSGRTIFEAVSKDRVPAFLNFHLSVGENPTRMIDSEENSYRIIEPHGANTFTLQPGVIYRLRIWGDSWTYREANFKF